MTDFLIGLRAQGSSSGWSWAVVFESPMSNSPGEMLAMVYDREVVKCPWSPGRKDKNINKELGLRMATGGHELVENGG